MLYKFNCISLPEKEKMLLFQTRMISLCLLFVLMILNLVLVGCNNANNTNEGELMTDEEIVEANTTTLLEEYESIGFDPKPEGAESSARSVAGHILRVHSSPIKVIGSDPSPYTEGRSLTITVADDEGNNYLLNIGPGGTLGSITDEHDNYLLTLIR